MDGEEKRHTILGVPVARWIIARPSRRQTRRTEYITVIVHPTRKEDGIQIIHKAITTSSIGPGDNRRGRNLAGKFRVRGEFYNFGIYSDPVATGNFPAEEGSVMVEFDVTILMVVVARSGDAR
ncbi:hypothetical protein FNV43_RR02666 [Rhamnella rubrinervis]|uniref:Uncharacterized protein n=1 Tax=Rhamnella rubrinervis TaxID=2594499 RepID=A0A8K0HSX5_9ROSA|nr:hypothetical protein FNV43_RR02666 [Rhamnella rubrinervis]